jgi:NitT/TauT family transport system substrate-binding protein
MADPSSIQNNKAQVEGLLRAIKKAYLFITTSSSAEVAEALVPSFDGTTKEELMSAVEQYIEIDAWSNSPAMSKDSFTRLLSVLKNAGTLEEDVDFCKIVDNTIANTI